MTSCANKMVIFYLYAQVAFGVLTWAQMCPSRCRCPEEPPMCGRGVPLILDDCACCLVCARQMGEICSELTPCDARKGLRCDYGAGAHKRTGVCAAHKGDVCIVDGSVYQNGETFFPSCKYQCTCRDGQMACVPRCNLDVMLPGPDCPFPRRVQVPGECCEKWVCEPQAESSALGGFTGLAAYRQEETLGFDAWDPSVNCIEQTTEWSACSRSCGMGLSTRVTNKNARCEMLKQNRLCMVRPCDMDIKQTPPPTADMQDDGACMKTQRSPKAIHLSYKNCTSVQAYRPRFCGGCSDGRCCTPHSTKTAQVKFSCPNKRIIKRPVMFINTCACHHHCPQDNGIHQSSDMMFPGGLRL